MHNLMPDADGSSRFIESGGSSGSGKKESLRLYASGAEFYGVTFTVGAEGTPGADDISVTIQLTDRAGRTLAKQVALLVWPGLADGTHVNTAVTAVTVSTGLVLFVPLVSGPTTSVKWILPDANGTIVAVYNQTGGAATRSICVMLPDGRIVESGTVTWA